MISIHINLEDSKVVYVENWTRTSVFSTTVTCHDQSCLLFIDSGSALNGVSQVLVN